MNALDLPRRNAPDAGQDGHCTVNGRSCNAPTRAGMALVDWLRQEQQVHTVHRGCDTGHCGSCAVMVDGHAVKSCAVLADEVQGQRVATADALPAQGSQVAAVLVREMQKPGVFQCGYCASAFVVAATELLERESAPDETRVRQAFDGLLCRCTGYQHIVDAVLAAAGQLQALNDAQAMFVQPTSLAAAEEAIHRLPSARLVAGGQQIARDMRGAEAETPWISLRKVAELRRIELRTGKVMAIGATCTHREIADSPLVAAHVPALGELASRLGDTLMRNRGTLGGALFDIVPGSSYPSALLALDATIVTTLREVGMGTWCDAPGSQLKLAPGEIVREIRFALPERACHRSFRPVPARPSLVSIFTAWRDGAVHVGVSGQSASPYLAHEAAAWLAGGAGPARWDRPSFSDWRADADYRNAMALALLQRLHSDMDNPTLRST